MGFKDAAQGALIFWEKHNTTILKWVGIGGAILTPILASRATLKAKAVIDEFNEQHIQDAGDEPQEDTDKKEDPKWYKDPATVKEVAKAYGPTAVAGAVTIGSIFYGDKLHIDKEAGLAAMSLAWEQRYKALEKKMVTKLGDEAVKDIKKELKKEQKPDPKKSSGGKSAKKSVKEELLKEFWVYDPITKQKFKTCANNFVWCNKVINENFAKGYVVTWSYIINLLGGKKTAKGDGLGFDPEDDDFVEFIEYNECGYFGYYWFDVYADMRVIDSANAKINGTSIPTIGCNIEPWDIVPFSKKKSA